MLSAAPGSTELSVGRVVGVVYSVVAHEKPAHGAVMLGRVVLGEIVGEVVDALPPGDNYVSGFNLVSDPVVAHVECLGALLRDGLVGNTGGDGAVRLYFRGRLWETHVGESGANDGDLTSGEEESAVLGLGCGANDQLENGGQISDGPVDDGSLV